MKKYILLIFSLLLFISTYSQVKVAILDFENTSGIVKYDGFGKAMSNMLITDLKNSIHPRKVIFLERSQLNKILEEQNLQKSKNFDNSTAVNFGKLAGVKYVLVGSVYVMDGICNITSRLVDVQTSEIIHAKESNGSINKWLTLKSVLAQELSTAMNNPVTIEAEYSEKETSEGVLSQYAKVIDKMDEGDVEGAEEMTEMLSAVQPDFKYFDELESDIEELKKQVEQNTADIKNIESEVVANVTDYLLLGNKYESENDFKNAEKYFLIGYEKVEKINIVSNLEYLLALSQVYYKNGNYTEAIRYADFGLSIFPYFKEFLYFKYLSLGKLKKNKEFEHIVEISKKIGEIKGDSLIISYLEKYAVDNKIQFEYIEEQIGWTKWPDICFVCLEMENNEVYFNYNFNTPFTDLASDCIIILYNDKPELASQLLKQLDLSKSSDNILFLVAWYSMLSSDFIYAKQQWDKIVLNSFSRVGDCANYGITKMVKPPNELKNSVITIRYVFDDDKGILIKDTIREYHPSGSVRKFPLSEEKQDTIVLKKPYWYYEYDNGSGFVTSDPIKAFIFKVNQQYPISPILDCIKSSGCISWTYTSSMSKMAIINWGHAYLLSGDLNTAVKIYSIFDQNYKFGEDFGYLKLTEVLISDWSEFEKYGLISHAKISDIKQKLNL
jgi:TolB-like protein